MKKPKRKLLLVNQEIAPYLTGTELSKKAHDFATHAHSNGYEVRTFMPRFGSVNERRNQLHEVIRLSGMNIPIDDNDHPLIIKVSSMQPSRIQVYFIDNDDFFLKEDTDEDAVGSNRADNDERVMFFARGTMETVKKLLWEPEIFACTGWFTALTAFYLRHMFTDSHSFKNTKVVYTVTDEKATHPLDQRLLEKMKAEKFSAKDLKPYKGQEVTTNLLHKMAIDSSNAVVFDCETVDPELLEAVQAKGIPYITREQLTDGPESLLQFYNSLLPDNEKGNA